MNEPARATWHGGFTPQFSTKALQVLKNALEQDDRHLLQGSTTEPPPLQCVQDWPVEGACPISYCGWKGEELETVGEVEEFFANACHEADTILGEPGACRYFLNYWDETPREVARQELLEEVQLTLTERNER